MTASAFLKTIVIGAAAAVAIAAVAVPARFVPAAVTQIDHAQMDRQVGPTSAGDRSHDKPDVFARSYTPSPFACANLAVAKPIRRPAPVRSAECLLPVVY